MLEHLGQHSMGRSGLQIFESTVILSLGILHRNKIFQLRLKSHPIEKDFRKTQFQLQSNSAGAIRVIATQDNSHMELSTTLGAKNFVRSDTPDRNCPWLKAVEYSRRDLGP